MDPINKIISTQLSEREVIIYMLVQSGMSMRDIAWRLATTHQAISKVNQTAADKIAQMGAAGLLQTPVRPIKED
jgi:transcriptional regulator